MDTNKVARLAYSAYGAVTGGKNFRGEDMPVFDDLGDTIQAAWMAAVTATRQEVLSIHGGGFADALAILHQGGRVWREGWNGKGMWVVLQAGYPGGVAINANTAKATGLAEGTVAAFRPYLMMKCVDDSFVPWVASQTDLLAHDWTGTGDYGD